ncbi:MAG: ABC transporter ATP-binding protein [Desulfurococcales archaeon]|nr:ABC transporter ATP-binding protein [Desulfurococcales archaeon]
MARVALRTEKLYCGYGKMTIVHGASIELRERELVALVGPNGAGKSTLLKGIYGIAKVFDGKILLWDEDVTKLSPEKKTRIGMAFVPQRNNVFPDLTVEENLEMGGYLIKDKAEVRRRIREIYELFPALERLKKLKAGNLSGGQRQMLAVGRALMTRPKVLLLDEPTAGLAPKIAMELMKQLQDVKKRDGVSIILVEQHAKRALEASDRGYVLVSGRIVVEGTGREILSRPDLQQIFLGLVK